jgi:hypothetical protein
MTRAWLGCAVLTLLLLGSAPEARAQSDFSGTWVTHNFGDGPNLIDLQATGNRVTGTISRGLQVNTIYDGTISGNTVTFKAAAAGDIRIITYTGRLNGNELAFTRTVEVRTAGGAGIYGSGGPMEFLATRELANGLAVPRALLGNWRHNLQRSRFDPGPAPTPIVADMFSFISMPGGRVARTRVTVPAGGEQIMSFTIHRADGRDYPVHDFATLVALASGEAPTTTLTAALRVVNERTFEVTLKNAAGTVTSRRRLEVSPDGNTLTETQTNLNAQGETTATNVVVSERIGRTSRPPTD